MASSLALQKNPVRRLVGLPPLEATPKLENDEALKEVKEAQLRKFMEELVEQQPKSTEKTEMREVTEEEEKKNSSATTKE